MAMINQQAAEPAQAEPKLLQFPSPGKVKNPAAVALGKLGGSKGGRIRAERLSPQERKSIAQRAAKARWAKARVVVEAEGSPNPQPRS